MPNFMVVTAYYKHGECHVDKYGSEESLRYGMVRQLDELPEPKSPAETESAPESDDESESKSEHESQSEPLTKYEPEPETDNESEPEPEPEPNPDLISLAIEAHGDGAVLTIELLEDEPVNDINDELPASYYDKVVFKLGDLKYDGPDASFILFANLYTRYKMNDHPVKFGMEYCEIYSAVYMRWYDYNDHSYTDDQLRKIKASVQYNKLYDLCSGKYDFHENKPYRHYFNSNDAANIQYCRNLSQYGDLDDACELALEVGEVMRSEQIGYGWVNIIQGGVEL